MTKPFGNCDLIATKDFTGKILFKPYTPGIDVDVKIIKFNEIRQTILRMGSEVRLHIPFLSFIFSTLGER